MDKRPTNDEMSSSEGSEESTSSSSSEDDTGRKNEQQQGKSCKYILYACDVLKISTHNEILRYYTTNLCLCIYILLLNMV